MKIAKTLFLSILAVALGNCADDGDMKGSLTLSITDSPMDADNVKSVNIFITSVDAQTGGNWKSIKSFDQPIGVNLTDYSGGNSFALVDQVVDPGKYTTLRFSMNLADLSSSLIRSPQCNVMFTNGTTKPLYYFESGITDITVQKEINISAKGHTDITLDFDVRKSLTVDDQGNYVFKPVIRVIETGTAGNIEAKIVNYNTSDRVVVFAYPSGQFAASEASAPASGNVRFGNAVTSYKIASNKVALGFLPAGSYDLIFARHNESGDFLSILGHFDTVTVSAGETTQLDIDLTKLTGS